MVLLRGGGWRRRCAHRCSAMPRQVDTICIATCARCGALGVSPRQCRARSGGWGRLADVWRVRESEPMPMNRVHGKR
eukprot:2480734-Prymnesium_polylepis.1